LAMTPAYRCRHGEGAWGFTSRDTWAQWRREPAKEPANSDAVAACWRGPGTRQRTTVPLAAGLPDSGWSSSPPSLPPAALSSPSRWLLTPERWQEGEAAPPPGLPA